MGFILTPTITLLVLGMEKAGNLGILRIALVRLLSIDRDIPFNLPQVRHF